MKLNFREFPNLLVVCLSVFVSLFLIIFLVVVFWKGETQEKVFESDGNRYISSFGKPNENITTNNLLNKESTTSLPESANKAKSGVLERDSNRKVIKFESELTDDQKYQMEEKYGVSFTEDIPKNGVYVVNSDEFSHIDSLESDELVSSLEVDEPIKLLSQQVDWGVERIGAQEVWGEAEGQGIIVAVVDTGVQIDHEDLSGNFSQGFDFVNNNDDAYDDNGHGTHVAGIIAAHDNNVGVVGGSYAAQIMPIKVLNAQGYGYLSDVVKGIYYAVDNNARIINLSLGTDYDSSILKDAVNHAQSNGVLVVAAAGNNSGDSCLYPAKYVGAICVVATDQSNKLASFSNRGGELSAPGVSNYSTYVDNQYAYLSGTSMATPHVSSSAALIFSYCSDCTSVEVREILQDTAVDLGEVGVDSIFGYGLVDVFAAIDSLKEEEEEKEKEEEKEEKVPEDEDIPEEERDLDKPSRPEVIDTPSDKSRKPETPPARRVAQSLRLLEPEINGNRRITFNEKKDINIKFELTPEVDDSMVDSIVVLIDNEKVFSTNQQEGEHLFEKDVLTNNQYVVRIVAYSGNRPVVHKNFIIDLTRVRPVVRNDRANPANPQNRRVLGVSTEFQY